MSKKYKIINKRICIINNPIFTDVLPLILYDDILDNIVDVSLVCRKWHKLVNQLYFKYKEGRMILENDCINYYVSPVDKYIKDENVFNTRATYWVRIKYRRDQLDDCHIVSQTRKSLKTNIWI